MVYYYGLVYQFQSWPQKPCPLQDVSVQANIVDMISEVTICQTFKNIESQIIDATYKFPIYEAAAVCAFEAEIDGRIIKGVAKEKQQAVKEYKEAVAQGHGAYLLEEQLADVFQCSLGNILPNQKVVIKITYVTELKHDSETERIRFVLPTTVSPRYGTEPQSQAFGSNLSYLVSSDYTLKLDITCQMTDAITSIESPSNLISTELNIDGNPKVCKVSLGEQITYLEKDFILVVKSKGLDQPRAFIEHDPQTDTDCVMLTLVPKFALKASMSELIFIMDRSGSMSGGPIKRASEALQLFLRSLPEDCFFNVVSFGSHFDSLFPKSQPHSEESFSKALSHAKVMQASYGGTEIYKVMQWVIQNARTDMPTSIFLLTDGEVWDVNSIVELIKTSVKENSDNFRVFSLGIGSSVSYNLVESVARAGNGYAQFVTNQERMDKKVIGMLKNAIIPPITDYKITWTDASEEPIELEMEVEQSQNEEKPTISFFNENIEEQQTPPPSNHINFFEKLKVCQAPYHIPPIYTGVRFIVYALLTKDVKPRRVITLSAKSNDGLMKLDIPVDPVTLFGSKIHTLAARKLIQDLEEGRSLIHNHPIYKGKCVPNSLVREHVVTLATQTASLSSRYTSFIAIDERSGAEIAETIVKEKTAEKAARFVGPGGGFTLLRSSFAGPGGGFTLPGSSSTPGSAGLFGFAQSSTRFGGSPLQLPAFGAQSSTGFGASPLQQVTFGAAQLSTGFGALQPATSGAAQPSTGFGASPLFGAAQPATFGFGAQSSTGSGAAQSATGLSFGATQSPKRSEAEELTTELSFGAAQSFTTALPAPQFSGFGFGAAQPVTGSAALQVTGSPLGSPMHPSAAPTQKHNPKLATIETLFGFLDLQSFDGKFEIPGAESEFRELFVVGDELPISKDEPAIWATAVAIAYMEIVMGEFKEECELFLEKAERALKKLTKNVRTEEILDEARQWVKNWIGK